MDVAFEHGLGAAHRLCLWQTGCDGCTRYSAGLYYESDETAVYDPASFLDCTMNYDGWQFIKCQMNT